MALDARPPQQRQFAPAAMTTSQLLHYRGPDQLNVSVELHRRFAFPVACIALALVGIPIGISTRKGGKSAGYVNAIFLAFFGYYLSSVSLIGVAQQQRIAGSGGRVAAGCRVRRCRNRLLFADGAAGRSRSADGFNEFAGADVRDAETEGGQCSRAPRFGWLPLPLLPQIVDTYILSNFVFYLALVLASFVLMTEVYNFFELMGDMIRNSSLLTMFTYLFFLLPAADRIDAADQRAGGGAGDAWGPQQAERSDGVQGVRREPVPAGRPDPDREHAVQRRAVRLQLPVRARRQPQAGQAARRNQGQAQTDLPESGPQVDHGARFADLLLQVFRPGREGDGGRQRLRARSGDVPPEAADPGAARGLERVDADVDLRKRLEQRLPRHGADQSAQQFPGDHLSGADRSARLFPEGSGAGAADELSRAAALHRATCSRAGWWIRANCRCSIT